MSGKFTECLSPQESLAIGPRLGLKFPEELLPYEPERSSPPALLPPRANAQNPQEDGARFPGFKTWVAKKALSHFPKLLFAPILPPPHTHTLTFLG